MNDVEKKRITSDRALELLAKKLGVDLKDLRHETPSNMGFTEQGIQFYMIKYYDVKNVYQTAYVYADGDVTLPE